MFVIYLDQILELMTFKASTWFQILFSSVYYFKFSQWWEFIYLKRIEKLYCDTKWMTVYILTPSYPTRARLGIIIVVRNVHAKWKPTVQILMKFISNGSSTLPILFIFFKHNYPYFDIANNQHATAHSFYSPI